MLLLLCALLLQAEAPAPRATLHFTYHERLIFVRARVDAGAERLFLLDTGASASALDARAADELGLARGAATTVEGTTGVAAVESAVVGSLAVGPLVVRELRVTVQDLAGTLRPSGETLAGILGSDFLARFVLELDFTARSLTLAEGPLAPLPGAPASVPLELDNGIPRVRATLDDVATSLRLDTGASLFDTPDVYVNVTEDVWDELRRADPALAPERHFTGAGVSGAVTLPVARIDALAVGATTIERPHVIVQPRQGYFARPYPGRRLVLGQAR